MEKQKNNDCELYNFSGEADLDKKSKSWEILESINKNIQILDSLNPNYKVILWENKLILKDTY